MGHHSAFHGFKEDHTHDYKIMEIFKEKAAVIFQCQLCGLRIIELDHEF